MIFVIVSNILGALSGLNTNFKVWETFYCERFLIWKWLEMFIWHKRFYHMLILLEKKKTNIHKCSIHKILDCGFQNLWLIDIRKMSACARSVVTIDLGINWQHLSGGWWLDLEGGWKLYMHHVVHKLGPLALIGHFLQSMNFLRECWP